MYYQASGFLPSHFSGLSVLPSAAFLMVPRWLPQPSHHTQMQYIFARDKKRPAVSVSHFKSDPTIPRVLQQDGGQNGVTCSFVFIIARKNLTVGVAEQMETES